MFCEQQIATGINAPGSHAEYMVAYADATTLIPNEISYEQAAPVFCAGYTVWSGLRFADLKPREKIAVLGIGGFRLKLFFNLKTLLILIYNLLK